MSKISLLIPAYRESKNLPKLTKELRETLSGEEFEIIIINDGNLDGSFMTIRKLEKEYREVKGLFSNDRRGKTSAIREGFHESDGDIIVMMDADLQYSSRDVLGLIESLKNADVVTGVRVNRKDGTIRKIESKIYNSLVRLFFDVKFNDCNSGLKVFKRDVLKEIIRDMKDGWHRYMLVLAVKRGHRVLEKPITHFKRAFGQSKFASPLKLFKGFYDMISVKVYLLG